MCSMQVVYRITLSDSVFSLYSVLSVTGTVCCHSNNHDLVLKSKIEYSDSIFLFITCKKCSLMWLCSPVSFAQNSYTKFSAKKNTRSVYIHEQYLLNTSATAIRSAQIYLNRNMNCD